MKNRLSKLRASQNGFTLVELLVYFGLFAILIVVINSLFITSLEQQTQDLSRSALQQESEYILAKLKYDIYNADTVSLPENPGDQGGVLELETDGVTSTYQLSGEKLTKTSGGEVWDVTSNRVAVESVQFENQSGLTPSQIIGLSVVLHSTQEDERASASRTVSTSVSRR
ncbi:type II secretion system protein [Candidatus Woesebacteria bacterium]|nr:type II secretion system protein [Candidatus Woesebacteria bacterium]